jgi:alkylation response protein AidB-like acyl-CoA dehydrogenase
MESALEWARQPSASGAPHLQAPDVQRRLARAATHTEISDLLCRRAMWAPENNVHNRYFGPMAKLFTTETYVEDSADLLELMAPDSLFVQPPPIGEIEQKHRQSVGTRIYGGTSQVHRSLIAEQGLGLPRTRA